MAPGGDNSQLDHPFRGRMSGGPEKGSNLPMPGRRRPGREEGHGPDLRKGQAEGQAFVQNGSHAEKPHREGRKNASEFRTKWKKEAELSSFAFSRPCTLLPAGFGREQRNEKAGGKAKLSDMPESQG